MGTACWLYRETGLAGSQEGWSCRWDTGAAFTSSPLGDSRNPLTRDSEATPAPLVLDAFAHSSPLLMPQTTAPGKGGAHYHGKVSDGG